MSGAVAAANDRLGLALLIAGALHILLIFGLHFEALQQEAPARQVEVTLVTQASPPPLDAQHFAQASQRGGDLEALRQRQPPPAINAAQAAASAGAAAGPSASSRRQEPVSTKRQGRAVLEDATADGQTSPLDATQRELARLQERLALLQADLQNPRRPNPQAREARVRRATTVAAFAALDAAYLVDWRNRVEALGNEYYPEASRRYGIYGSLEMLVTVRSDGALDAIEILRSSGHAVLDEAAVRIVRAAAPYAPFPRELRESTDKLEIQRTWQFEENPLSSQQRP